MRKVRKELSDCAVGLRSGMCAIAHYRIKESTVPGYKRESLDNLCLPSMVHGRTVGVWYTAVDSHVGVHSILRAVAVPSGYGLFPLNLKEYDM